MIYLVRDINYMEHHPFIEKRRTRTRPVKLLKVTKQVDVKALGGKGNSYQYTKTGRRKDLGPDVYRSGWESDFARILKSFGIQYQFEPRTYYFPVKRGTKSYVPDFYLTKTDEYVEIKGWFDDKSRIKLTRFKRYFPDEFKKLHVVISKYDKKALKVCEDLGVQSIIFFQDLKVKYNWINNWESNR